MFETYGYPLESHKVETEDGYLLSLWRVPTGKIHQDTIIGDDSKPKISEPARPAVLLVHGLVASADLWFTNSPDKSLPFILADKGFDVWACNLRGTPESKGHISLKSDSQEFWDFSFHEMSQFDIPATINYILDTTGTSDLLCIGHSMGAAVLIITLGLKPEYCTKIRTMIALAPAVYLQNIPNKISKFIFLPLCKLLGRFNSFQKKEMLPDSFLDSAKKICPPRARPENVAGWMVKNMGSVLGSFGKEQIEPDRLSTVAGAYPTSTSGKVLVHGAQCYYAGRFQQFDYGDTGNMKKYDQLRPPLYDLSKVHVPTVIFYSEADQLCSPIDIARLSNELPNVIGFNGIPAKSRFGHNDFLVGKDGAELVYDHIVRIFTKNLGIKL